MYCSEECRDSDGSSTHLGKCDLHKNYPASLANLKLGECTSPGSADLAYTVQMGVVHLIKVIGLDNIKKTVLLGDKSMESLGGDPRTKGFQDGKFEAVTLEALLSLEDNLDKLSSAELLGVFQV